MPATWARLLLPNDDPAAPSECAATRPDAVPNASSPQLLTHLLERIARGVRSSRALNEALGVDPRTVRYYVQAGAWLGFLVDGPEPVLTADGLAYVYGGAARPEIYARVVGAQPMVAELLARTRGATPTDDQVAAAILKVDRDLSPSTVERRASALRGLIAPCLRPGLGARLADEGSQLLLPLAQIPISEPEPPTKASGRSFSPDVYRYLLCFLLDHGELTLGHLRGLLDRIGADDVPIGGYVDLAISRGDAVRVDERLVVTAGAASRREVADSTASVILSDGGWRTHVDALRARAKGPSDRWRLWDRRLLGRDVDADTIEVELRRVLRDRGLDGWPRAVGPAPARSPSASVAFLDTWDQQGLVLALPPSLAQLWEGVAGVNRHLRNARHRADAVGSPTLASRPSVVHGGVLHPGEPLPRAVPDLRSLRVRALRCAPYLAMTTALLLAHRTGEVAGELRAEHGGWVVRRHRASWGELLEVCDAFARSRGWIPSRRVRGGLDARTLVSLLERLGVAVVADDRLVLDDTFFVALRGEEDEAPLRDGLARLGEVMAAYLASTAERA
jgi:hypothetical protein